MKKEITRKEYLLALDIIEEYHKQIGISNFKDLKKTKVRDWHRLKDCTFTLKRILTEDYLDFYIEDLNFNSIKSMRGLGSKAAENFEDLKNRPKL